MKVKNNWPVKNLIEALSEISDGNYSSKYPKSQDFVNQGAPFIRAINFKNGKLVWDNMRYINSEKHAELKKGHLKTDDIVITTRGEIGATAYVTPEFDDANINAQIVRLHADPEEMLSSFLFYLFNSYYIKNQLSRITTGSTLKQLSVQNLHLIKVQVPPISTQKEIVKKLDAIRKAQELIDLQIQKIEELFESFLVNKFSINIWRKAKLGDLVVFSQLGLVKSKQQQKETGVPYVKMDAIQLNGDLNLDKAVFVDADVKEINNFKLIEDDFLFNTRNTPELVGKSTVFSGKDTYLFNNNILRLRFKDLLSVFLNSFLHTLEGKRQLGIRKKGTTSVSAIYQSSLMTIEVPTPPLAEQMEIVEKLNSIQEYKKLLQKQKELYKELFDSVLDKSMKGGG